MDLKLEKTKEEKQNQPIPQFKSITIKCCQNEQMSQPQFGLSVKVKPTLPKVGSWNPLGLPKTQSAISGVKSPCI
jgi:hypothetical protein